MADARTRLKKNDSSCLKAAATILCWSTLAPVTKALLADLSYMQVLFVSSSFAVAFLLAVNIIQKKHRILLSYSIRDILIQVGLGFIGLFLYSALYYYSLSELSSQDACIINYLWPIMIILFSAPILKEKITAKKMTAVLLSFFGLIIVATRGNISGFDPGGVKGVVACFFAAVCYGLFSALNKKTDYDQSVAMTIYFGVTAAASGVGCALQGGLGPISTIQMAGFIWIGVFTDAIAYFLWALALKGGDTAKISNLAYMTPFLSILISAAFLREPIYPYSIVGLFFIMAGIVWMSVNVRNKFNRIS